MGNKQFGANPVDESFARELKALMERLDLSVEDVARSVSASRSCVERWLSGKTMPSPALRRMLIQELSLRITVACAICKNEYKNVIPFADSSQGLGCAASANPTATGGCVVRGHWGSGYDGPGDVRGPNVPTGWTLPADPVCDACITAAIDRGELAVDPHVDF